MTSDQRLHMQLGLEDMGEASFYPCLIIPAVLLITPLGAYPSLAVFFGAILLAISVQLAFRLPYLAVPAVFRDPLVRTALFQSLLQSHLTRKSDATQERRRIGHWGTLPPFDIVPRVLLGLVGIIAILGSGMPGLPHIMGLAAVLITLSLAYRSILALLFGAATLSLSSLIPILSL